MENSLWTNGWFGGYLPLFLEPPILIEFSIINHPFGGFPIIFGNTHLLDFNTIQTVQALAGTTLVAIATSFANWNRRCWKQPRWTRWCYSFDQCRLPQKTWINVEKSAAYEELFFAKRWTSCRFKIHQMPSNKRTTCGGRGTWHLGIPFLRHLVMRAPRSDHVMSAEEGFRGPCHDCWYKA